MGYAGNLEPQYIIPTAICTNTKADKDDLGDLDFYIGYDAIERAHGDYQINYPIRHGQIDNWDNMEKYWEHCLFKYMRCEPEDHFVLLVRFRRKKKMLTTLRLNHPLTHQKTENILLKSCSKLLTFLVCILPFKQFSLSQHLGHLRRQENWDFLVT